MPPKRKSPNAPDHATNDAAIRERGFAPFLRPDHVSNGEWLKLTGFNTLDHAKNQIKVEVQNERGEDFVIGVRDGSPDHRMFFKAFNNADYRQWRSGGVKVKIVNGREPGSQFVNVGEVDTDGPVWGE